MKTEYSQVNGYFRLPSTAKQTWVFSQKITALAEKPTFHVKWVGLSGKQLYSGKQLDITNQEYIATIPHGEYS